MPTTFASLALTKLTAEEKLDILGQLWADLVASMPPGGLLTESRQRTGTNRSGVVLGCAS